MRREHPMLFKDRLVRALLDGSKTQTRRPVKPQPKWLEREEGSLACPGWSWSQKNPRVYMSSWIDDESFASELKEHAPWSVGDLIWVRETWAESDDEWGAPCSVYAADLAACHIGRDETRDNYLIEDWHTFDEEPPRWTPSIHQPKWACRLWLEITDVRVERVASISEEDAAKEGIPFCEKCDKPHCGQWGRGAIDDELSNAAGGRPWRDCYGICKGRTYKEEFRDNWEILYPGSWERNDWVWAISFKRTEAKK